MAAPASAPLDEEVAAPAALRRQAGHAASPTSATRRSSSRQAAEFYKLGLGKLVCVSAQQNRGKDELLAPIQRTPARRRTDWKPRREAAMKLAIVGRRNTGKSTFINCLAQSERMIVSEVAGTTRDSVDVRFERDGKAFIAIDTAGVRKKRSMANDIEFYSLARAERSIRRADVVLLFFDAAESISKVDKQLADYILEQHKPAIFVVNKWDLMTPMPTGKMGDYLRATFPEPRLTCRSRSSRPRTGKNVQPVLEPGPEPAQAGQRPRRHRRPQPRAARRRWSDTPPPMRQNRRPKVYYATQVATNPPTIVLFTNGPELFDNTYQRYLAQDVPRSAAVRRRADQAVPAGQATRGRSRRGRAGRGAARRGRNDQASSPARRNCGRTCEPDRSWRQGGNLPP